MEGFGEYREWIATHTRRVLFVKRGDGDAGAPGDFWVLLDTFRPRDKDSHRYECVFHLDAPAVEVDETTRSVVTRHEEGTNLGIFPLGTEGLEVTVIEGQEEPFVQGWLPLRTASMTGVRPIPTPVFSVEGAGEVRMACVFVPVPQGSPNVSVKPWRLDTLETDDGLGLEITSRDGLRLLALFPEDHSQTWNGLGHSFSGPVWVAEEANGAWQRVAP